MGPPQELSQSVESGTIKKELLDGEGRVDTFDKLFKSSKKSDNLSAHHVPNDKYMNSKGISTKEGMAIMVEDPVPGKGGRHREIHKTLQRQDETMSPRDALAQGIHKVREVYQKDGVYNFEIRESLQEVIEQNKERFPHLFEKKPK